MLNWRLFHQSPTPVPQKLLEYGVVVEPICPYCSGVVLYRGRWYRAKCPLSITIAKDRLVMVKIDFREYLEVVPLDSLGN